MKVLKRTKSIYLNLRKKTVKKKKKIKIIKAPLKNSTKNMLKMQLKRAPRIHQIVVKG